jgi:anti-sigma B factor antagonist
MRSLSKTHRRQHDLIQSPFVHNAPTAKALVQPFRKSAMPESSAQSSSQGSNMEIVQTRHNDVCVLSLNGRLDSNSSAELDRQIMNLIEEATIRLVIDCKKLDYITSAGLRIMIKTAKMLKGQNGAFVLCEMADYVREIFEIAGFDKFLTIVSGLEEAVTACRSTV